MRHGATQSNLEKRYIGKTDEALCAKGIDQLSAIMVPNVEMVFSSLMKRCLQTANLAYKETSVHVIEDIKECDFGDFENKNYKDLQGNEDYQRWIDSNGILPFPNGEDIGAFKKRSIRAFYQILEIMAQKHATSAAIITHGGVIMSILEAHSTYDFYHFHIKNAEGYDILYHDGKLLNMNRW